MNDFVRLLAAWALVHETADEGWKAAVSRGRDPGPGSLDQGAGAFTDGLAALVAEEKDRLKAALAGGGPPGGASGPLDLAGQLDGMRFEIAELRGRIESLQASIDALASRGKN
jgi:hypothetical protein